MKNDPLVSGLKDLKLKLFPKKHNSFMDIDEFLEIGIIDRFVLYVEADGGLDYGFSKEEPPEIHVFPKLHEKQMELHWDVLFYYNLIKITLADLEEKEQKYLDGMIEFKVDDCEKRRDYAKENGDYSELENKLEELRTEIMVWIVSNRRLLWS